jgi:hypothetical protein
VTPVLPTKRSLPPIAITKSEEAFLKTLDPDHAAKVLLKTAAVYSFLVREAKRLMPTYCRRPKMDAVLDEIEIELGLPSRVVDRSGTEAFTLVGPKQFSRWVNAYLMEGVPGLLPHYHHSGRRRA